MILRISNVLRLNSIGSLLVIWPSFSYFNGFFNKK